MTLTDDQRAAVEARGGSLTLSAAAGSGKTRVLTERVAARILDPENPIDADRLLIVTFTRAAAAEMKGRITARLSEHLREHPQDMRAKRQKLLLGRAQIGTIDALCTAILRENFQAAGICAGFRIGDEAEMTAMREQVIGDVLEEAYRGGSPHFRDLAELFSSAGSDSSLSDTIAGVLDFARSHPYYRTWMDEKLVIYRSFAHPRDSLWAQILFERALELVRLEKSRLEKTLGRVRDDAELCVYTDVLEYDIASLGMLENKAESRDWDGCIDVLEGYCPARIPSPRKVDKAIRDSIRDVRSHAKDLLQKELPASILPAREEEFAADVSDLLPKVDCLFSLVRQTDERLQSEKTAAGVLDFADLEQLVCTLLTHADGTPTPLAGDLAARYDEVMLDESQDINEVQNRILSALSAHGGLFCVGDVKQCIYRFRMACPQLFLERVAAGHPYDGRHFPATLYLNGNFRTAPQVTGIINLMFSRLMSRQLGEVDYDCTQALDPQGTFAQCPGRGVDLCLVRDEKGLGEADENLYAEPVWVAGEISRLLKTAQVDDGGTLRPIRAGDIAILLRSPRSGAERYRRALQTAGIETRVQLESGFLTAPEIAAVLNALTAISNPMRDVEMLGYLSGPLGGFSDDELADMRVHTPRGPLYPALCAYAAENEHAQSFLREFEDLRRLSLVLPPEELIGEILRRTGFDLVCRRMKRGAERSANLTLLQHYAGQTTGDGSPTLESFLARIERIRARGRDLVSAPSDSGGDAVSIVSIHRSKGLEWPVVFVCELGRIHSFFKQDLSKPTILTSDCGFACVRRDRKTRRQFASVPLLAVRAQKKRDLLSEELRVLYVAATRAKERLYLTGSVSEPSDALAAALREGAGTSPLPPAAVGEGKSFLDWILPALSGCGDLVRLAETGARENGLRLHIETENTVCRVSAAADDTPAEAPAPDEAQAAELAAQMQWQYPHADAAVLPAKMSVSALTHTGTGTFFSGEPKFISGRSGSGAVYGTAMHMFLQSCDIAAARRDTDGEIARLAALGILSPAQQQALGRRSLRTFFAGALAERMERCTRLLREYRMLAPASASALASGYALPDGEATMLQGVADAIMLEGDYAVLIDYKTDRVGDADELLSRYREQLLLYRDLLGNRLGIPVREGIIYSFFLGREIQVF